MNILNVLQGTEEWLSIRAKCFTASEAPSALGVSKYLSRNELLNQKSTGECREISDVQQSVFDKGHQAEEHARAIAEDIVGNDLFPVTATLEVDELKLLASYDGVTFGNNIIWEHKLWSEELAKQIKENNIDQHYSTQMDQQLLISGAEKCLFMTSDGTNDNCAWMWYETNEDKKTTIISTWKQFKKDLETFEPQPKVIKPEANAIKQLPSLNVQISGQVVASNLTEFKIAANDFIESINTKLISDNDFVNAEADVKFCDEIEKKLEVTKSAVIGQSASINDVMREIDFIKESVRSKRLTLEKLVKSQKENIKKKIIDDAYKLCAEYLHSVDPKHSSIHLGSIVNLSRQSFETACKNKRTLSSLQNAVDTEVATFKIKINDIARAIQANLLHLPNDLSLFRDLQQIITKTEDDFKRLVYSRLEEQQRKEEEATKRAIEQAKDRAIAMQKAAEERDKLSIENKTKLNEQKESSGLKPKTEQMIIMDDVVAQFVALGLSQALAERLFLEIKSGQVKHVAII